MFSTARWRRARLPLTDREQIIRTLDDPQTALAELGATLLEHDWRVREGLV